MANKNLALTLGYKVDDKATGPLKNLRKSLDLLGNRSKAASDGFKALGKTEKLANKWRDLNAQSKVTAERLEAAKAKSAALSKEFKAAEKPSKELKKALEAARKETHKLGVTFGHEKRDLAQYSDDLKGLGFNTKTAGASFLKLERDVKRAGERLERYNRLQKSVGKAGVHFKNTVGGAWTQTRRIGLAGIAAAGSLMAMAQTTADAGDNAAKTAKKIGITSEELQELRYAGERSGMSIDTLDTNIFKFTKRIGLAARGSGAAKKAYKALGLEANELAKKSPVDALDQVTESLFQVEDHAQRVALATQIFGDSGAGMLEMLAGGSAGLQQLREDARATGYVLSNQATADGEAYSDAMLDAQLALKGLSRTMGAELLPSLTEVAKRFTHWVKTDREGVQNLANTVSTFVTEGVPRLLEVADKFMGIAGALGTASDKLAGFVGGYENLFQIAAGLSFAKPIWSAGKLVGSVTSIGTQLGGLAAKSDTLAPIGKAFGSITGAAKTLGWALLTNPMTWIFLAVGAAVGGLAYVVYNNFEAIKQNLFAFGDWLGGLATTFGTRFVDGFKNFGLTGAIYSSVFQPMMAKFGVDLPANFTEFGRNMIQGLFNGIDSLKDAAIGKLQGIGSAMVDGFKSLLGINSPSTLFTEFGGNLVQGLINGIIALKDAAIGKLQGIGSAMVDGFKSLLGINSPSTLFTEFGGNLVQGLINGIMALKDAAIGKLQGIGSSMVSGFKNLLGIKSPSRVMMRHGGDVTDGLNLGMQRGERDITKRAGTLAALMAAPLAASPVLANPLTIAPQHIVNTSTTAQHRGGDTFEIKVSVQINGGKHDAHSIGNAVGNATVNAIRNARGGALYDQDF